MYEDTEKILHEEEKRERRQEVSRFMTDRLRREARRPPRLSPLEHFMILEERNKRVPKRNKSFFEFLFSPDE